jgi:hypothetical protein
MSETPQTPPPPEPPPSGSGGATGRPAGGGYNADQMKAAVTGANPYDLGIIGAGVLAFIFSLFSYYKASASGGGFSVSTSESAWHGFFGWFAALVALVASALLAAAILGVKLLDAKMLRLVLLVAYGVAAVCVILALFVIPGKVDVPGVDYGHGIGYWVSLIVILAGLGLSFLRKDAES